jgi:hypothetical protein
VFWNPSLKNLCLKPLGPLVRQETSYGLLAPPLGSVRLTIIELVAVLLRTGSPAGEAAVICSGVLRRVLDIFLHFPFNSILHHQARLPIVPRPF